MPLTNMKLLAFALLLPTADALFFQFLIDLFGERICQRGIDAIGLGDQLNCDCDGKFSFSPFGITAAADCTTKEPICLDQDSSLFCGNANLDADFGAGDGFEGTVKVCLDIQPDLGLPDNLDDLFSTTLCISGTAKDEFALSSCEATLGEACLCEPCGGDEALVGVDIDCSGVNINPLADQLGDILFIPGPNPGCLSLALDDLTGFLPGNSTLFGG